MPFSFESSSIRVVTKQDGAWSVVAKDVALALGYVWSGMATIGQEWLLLVMFQKNGGR